MVIELLCTMFCFNNITEHFEFAFRYDIFALAVIKWRVYSQKAIQRHHMADFSKSLLNQFSMFKTSFMLAFFFSTLILFALYSTFLLI